MFFQKKNLFSVLSSRIDTKNLLETKHQMYFCLHHDFYKFLSIFGHFCYFAAYILFLKIMGSEECLERCDSYGDFFLSNIFILGEFCKRTQCPPIVTLALLLFLMLFSVFHRTVGFFFS